MLYNKIDVHAHYLSPGYKKFLKDQFNDMGDGVKTPDYSIDTTLSIMDKTKIDYSIISISSPHMRRKSAFLPPFQCRTSMKASKSLIKWLKRAKQLDLRYPPIHVVPISAIQSLIP